MSIVTKIAEEDGLEAIIDAIDWYRYHAEVCNWGLWTLFTLCFGHTGNKKLFVGMLSYLVNYLYNMLLYTNVVHMKAHCIVRYVLDGLYLLIHFVYMLSHTRGQYI